MRRTDTPSVAPAQCYTCDGLDGPFVDTLREEIRGRVYICSSCFEQMRLLLKPNVPANDSDKRRIRALELDLGEIKEEHDALRKAVVLTLQQGAVSRHGVIQLRKRR